MRYNVPTYNRFSPLRNQQGPYSLYRRNFREERDFPRERQRDRPPGRWKACVPYRTHGWRGWNGNRGGTQRGDQRRTGEDQTSVRNQRYGERTSPNHGWDHTQGRDIEPTQRNPERRSRQEEGEEVRRKRRRVY